MKRHPFNLASFLIGIWFVVAGVVVTVGDFDTISDISWLGPALVGCLGLVIVVSAVRSGLNSKTESVS